MSPPPKSAREIFDAALERPETERSAFVAEACQGDAALRERVEALLRAHEAAGGFMEHPPALSIEGRAGRDSTVQPGERVGRYKLLQEIGEGGCGVVYLAEQEEPVRRQVALKVIKLGMDTRSVIARFEAERQALALMDHQNIAKVFDAGITDSGRPYFVMELVKGVPITDYCDTKGLNTERRLRLFIQVCQAIQHAHQKGIIHRDIKPSNILVSDREGVPEPKIIDFGIAKATNDQRLTDKTIFTAVEQFIGTPAYMSPEQARSSGQDIDTRSDIYSLGVLLYELLTGATPFDAHRLRQAALDEVRRIIREEDPAAPSTRLGLLPANDLAEAARRRQVDPTRLRTLIRGELDWIVMKALEKERGRRYETANGLARDVERHLADEPVTARPTGRLYRLQKLVRRHRAAAAAFTITFLSLAGGLGISIYLLAKETQAHRQADHLRLVSDNQAAQIRHQLYASQVNLGFQAWERGDITRAEDLLEKQRPKPGQEDERGFEWYYLWRLLHSAQVTLLGHNAIVRCVAFSPDGRLVATGGDDATARLWDAQTGKLLRVLSGHSYGVNCVAFSPDGRILATGGVDKDVKLWDVATGRALATLRGHVEDVTALAFFPDGKRLASASGTLTSGGDVNPSERLVIDWQVPSDVRVWDVESRNLIETLGAQRNGIISLAVAPDGRTIATATTDGKMRFWDVATGENKTNSIHFDEPVMTVSYSPDGRYLAVGGGSGWQQDSALRIIDLATGKERVSLNGHDGPVLDAVFSPDGRTLASAAMDQIVRLWDCKTGAEKNVIRGHRAFIFSVAFAPSGKRIATASWDQTAKIWDAAGPQDSQAFTGAGGYSSSFLPDGRLAVGYSGYLKVIQPGSGQEPLIIPNYRVQDPIVAASPDGSILAAGGTDRTVTLWDTRTWQVLAHLPGHVGKLWGLGFSPDGRTLASADARMLRIWDVAKLGLRGVYRPNTKGHLGQVLFTPDGRSVITGGGGEAVVLDVETGNVEGRLGGVDKCLAISRDGRWLAASVIREDWDLELIDRRTLEVKWHTTAHAANIWGAAFAPDGKTLATASWDGTVKLWNVASGLEVFSRKTVGVSWSVDFSRDGLWWAAGSGSSRRGQELLFQAANPADVPAADSPPVIEGQPTDQLTPDGGGAVFRVAAIGDPPLSYQWRHGTNNLGPLTNSPVLTLTDVSRADAGTYGVVIFDRHGSVTSSNATLKIVPVREQLIGEIDPGDKGKAPVSYSASAACEHGEMAPVRSALVEGAGINGASALMFAADGSGLTNDTDQIWGFFMGESAMTASKATGLDTTNLNWYKVEATIRTSGLLGTNSHGGITLNFLTPAGQVLPILFQASFTTNYQVYSYLLGNGHADRYRPGSWSDFINSFDEINQVSLRVSADNWLKEYDLKHEDAFYVADFKFKRLIPDNSTESAALDSTAHKSPNR